jgi:signal transduction histidine kinase
VLGGSIQARSEPGQGLCVAMRLPRRLREAGT